MTEVGRIINDGLVPNSYFEEEVRSEYLVSTKKKKIWAVELDLYKEFARVCAKHNLSYFALGGTILGAVRHRGFIPWDDDMDVCMPRKDYDILCNEFTNEFSSPYFLQTPYTDDGYFFSFNKLRNTNTSSISMPYKSSFFNQGIALDIFPLDYCELSNSELKEPVIKDSIMKCSSYMKRGSEKNLDERQRNNFSLYQTSDPFKEWLKIQAYATSVKSSDYLGLPVCTVYKFNRLLWPAKCFDSFVDMNFESIKIRVPIGWDEILRICFGDYMKFPPVDQRGTWHSSVYWDPDVSYKTYIKDGCWDKVITDYLFH